MGDCQAFTGLSRVEIAEHLRRLVELRIEGERKMSELKKGLASLGLDNAIRLRWALRDVKGKRLKLTPVDPNDLRTLIDMGYVEIQNDVPVLTSAGLEEMEIGD
jgi:hypothetical protein